MRAGRQAAGRRAVWAAWAAALAVAALAACAAPTHIDGHKIRAAAGPAGGGVASAHELHRGAPAWFADWWGGYLRHAAGGHAVLALDRGGLGGWYVYCPAGGCHLLDSPWARPIRDVHYTYRARERCRARIERAYPGAQPACAVYAIRGKIVWEGPLPWKGGRAAPANTNRPAIGASPDMIGVRQALDMIEWWGMGDIWWGMEDT